MKSRLIIVLDDDPTGSQTVHGINVYTDWKQETITGAFKEEKGLFFILTNSRSFSRQKTAAVHREIAMHISRAAAETKRDFLIISRSDSTLRGHYPLETAVLKDTLEKCMGIRFDGELLVPFFPEGGRYTVNDIHYVRIGEKLIPAGETEFAKDPAFGFRSSDLKEYCEEKTEGQYKAEDVTSISLDELRSHETAGICGKLQKVTGFGKVIVNAETYEDLSVFSEAFLMSLEKGKNFLIRGAAAIVKVLGRIDSVPLLRGEELVDKENGNGGLVVVGSYVKRSSGQLSVLLNRASDLAALEISVPSVLAGEWKADACAKEADRYLKAGRTVVLYTTRKADANDQRGEEALETCRKVSEAVTDTVAYITERPSFIIAKGGITSSDIGVKALGVKKALVQGQLVPGVPVWKTGAESRFPGMPYIIFPGNVGNAGTLCEAVEKMTGRIRNGGRQDEGT